MSLQFQDVYSVEEPDLMALVPRPVYALVLVIPDQRCIRKSKEGR